MMSTAKVAAKLDDNEEHFFIPAPDAALYLFLRLLRSRPAGRRPPRAVLYLHGATFPTGLSVAHRFDGRSWRDALCAAGFDVWGLDLLGFGNSDRYLEMSQPAEAHEPLGVARDVARQVAAAARFILEHQGLHSLSIIAHSWGSMPACLFASEHPTLIERIVLFAPIARREPTRYLPRPTGPAWRLVSVEDQWARFVEDVPQEEPPVLSRLHFDAWAEAYLDSDPDSRTHDPAGVKVPSGPLVEILRAWQGELAYDPARVQNPVCIIRGGWDGLIPDTDARWLFDALSRSTLKRDIKIGRGTHLMHLEAMRPALWQESIGFLLGEDVAPIPT
jgi:pimeloyl-ACP methyl ester carboxylesterase